MVGVMEKQPKLMSQIHTEECWPLVGKLSPCEEACPIHMDVPSYVIAIAQGKFKESLAAIRQSNPFPSICGRVCHHPCESQCSRALIDEPVAIQWLKRFVADNHLKDAKKPRPIRRTKKEKVAIIGSGPAGMTAANDLIKQGYGVVVYEAMPIAGGMMATGIPDFILPREIVDAEVNHIRDLGVEIKTNVRIGTSVSVEELKKQGFNAFLLASGAQKSAQLKIPGIESENVYSALQLLQAAKTGGAVRLKNTVMVIGGGNAALDAARLVRRLGADEVHVACLEARKDMPAFTWAIEDAEKEGIKIHTSLAPQRFAAGYTGGGRKCINIEFTRVTSTTVDADGRISWTLMEGPGSQYTMGVDSVVIAIGQMPDLSCADDSGVKAGCVGAFEADPDTLETNVRGIFAAGDSVSVRGTVVEAIAMGHKAAISIHRYLRGHDLKKNRGLAHRETIKCDPQLAPLWLTRKARWEMPALSPGDAARSFDEVNLGYTQAQAIEEAKRCLNCRMCANCIFERSQICPETGSRLMR
ncbi:FAD-dependent oxidoreductase [Chloroflexota bacterium]